MRPSRRPTRLQPTPTSLGWRGRLAWSLPALLPLWLFWHAGGPVAVVLLGVPFALPGVLCWWWGVWSPTGERAATARELCQDEIAAAFVPPPRQHLLFGGEPDQARGPEQTPVRC